MPSSLYYPARDGDLVVWYNNFNVKLPGYAAALGLVAADTASVAADYVMLAHSVNQVAVFTEEARERTRYKDTFKNGPLGTPPPATPVVPVTAPPATIPLPGILPRLRALVKRIKSHPSYTAALGKDLGIVAPEPTPFTGRPTGSAVAVAGSVVQVRFIKNGFPGVFLESRRGNETEWTGLGIAISSPFADSRPPLAAGLPEVRTYRLRYVKENLPVGGDSDVLSVTTVP